jgi:multidrug efflux system membrane fusion protein
VPIEQSNKTAHRLRSAAIVAGLAGIAGAGLYFYQASVSPSSPASSRSAPRPIPVSVAVASHRDVPVYVTGLGSVQASFTIAIHSQVDGIMQDVRFTEGAHVRKGDVLAQIDPRLFQAALDQAKAKRMQDIALLGSAQKDLARSETLVEHSVATQQLVDQQQARADQLKASIAADEAAIETAQTQLDYTAIKSPSDGRIGIRVVDPGNLVHASDARPIATVVLTQPSAVVFTLPMQYLDDLRDAMARGPVEVIAYEQHNRRPLSTGQLLLVDNMIDQATATVRLKAMFPNSDERLWPGEFVNAHVLLETRESALVIPTTAIQRGSQGLFAWAVSDAGTAVAKPIKLGPVSGDLTIITEGLDQGDRVVIDGQYKLQLNAPVLITKTTALQTAETEK